MSAFVMNNVNEVLKALSKGELTQEQAAQLLANPPKRPKGINFSVTPKGCIAISGIRRRGVYLYPNEVVAILGQSERLLAFINDPANQESLSFAKGDKDGEEEAGKEAA